MGHFKGEYMAEVVFVVETPGGKVSVFEGERMATNFFVTPSGALIFNRENEHATWQFLAFNAGQWHSVRRPAKTGDHT